MGRKMVRFCDECGEITNFNMKTSVSLDEDTSEEITILAKWCKSTATGKPVSDLCETCFWIKLNSAVKKQMEI